MIASPMPMSRYNKRKILICAYACDPRRGSEQGVGWNWVYSIAQLHDVWLITDIYNRTAIESILRSDSQLSQSLRVAYVDPRAWHYSDANSLWRWVERSPAKPIMHIAYALWQKDALELARNLQHQENFDLVHQLTFVGFRFPGHLWRLGLPFVWGPIGGLEDTPWRLLPAMGANGALYYAGRNLINAAQRRWLRTPRRAAAAAGPGLIAATPSIARALKGSYGADSTVISEVVAPLELSPPAPRARAPGEPLRVVWSGLHLPGKALNLLLEAMSQIEPTVAIKLHILGDGPQRGSWTALAERLGVAERCIWHGSIPRHEALRLMDEAHVLAITSLKDLTSTVLLEGLALGLPVICPDHCGFSDVVTEACGIKVDPASAHALIAGFRSALLRVAGDESMRYRMAGAALLRARDFSREALQVKLDAVYQRVLSCRKPTGMVVE